MNCDYDMALSWGVCAKNALGNHDGYSANQMVFGRNINLPSILTDSLPALEPTRSSEVVRRNLEAMHTARQNFIKAESSEKIRRALRHKVRSFSDNRYENGEKVFYKRVGFKGWRGPATVIGEEGKIVLVRHGTAYYRCHPCHLMKVMRRGIEGSGATTSSENAASSKCVGDGITAAPSEVCSEPDDCANDCGNGVIEESVETGTNETDDVIETEANEKTIKTEVSSLDNLSQDGAEINSDRQQKQANVRSKRNTHVKQRASKNPLNTTQAQREERQLVT